MPNDGTIKVGISQDQVMKKILMLPGLFAEGRRVYTSFSSRCRPILGMVQRSMEDLEAAGFGIFKLVSNLRIFYKQLPSDLLQPKLAAYGMSLEEYTVLFRQEDERLTSRNRDEILDQLPEELSILPN